MNDSDRDQVKQAFREQHGIEISDEDIDHAAEAANQAVLRKKEELDLLPLRQHLYFDHYAGPTIGLGIKMLQAIHETAPKQGSHADE